MPDLKSRQRKRKRPSTEKAPGPEAKVFKADPSCDDSEVSFNNSKPVLPRRSPNGFILPDPLPAGFQVRDLHGCRWTLGESVGLGGFGEIYSARSPDARPNHDDVVVKVEPHTNGPLFVEVNFYLRSAQRPTLDSYRSRKGLDHLGVPPVRGSGSFVFKDKKYRFLVIPRYGTDLQTLLDDAQLTLSAATAGDIALQVVDSYQYIHSCGYVHKDLKGSNVLFERGQSKGNVFLVDYGLASRFGAQGGVHKPYASDARSAHEGTLEYASRDAHLGCASRRGDVEVLLYNLIDWTGGRLPWDRPDVVKPPEIEAMKRRAFRDPAFLRNVFRGGDVPHFLAPLMRYVDAMSFEEEPDYRYLRSLFTGGPDASSSSSDEVTLSIETKPSVETKRKKVRRVRNEATGDSAATVASERRLRQMSAQRFVRESEAVHRQRMEEGRQNPTPAMVAQMKKLEARRRDGSTWRRRRNRSLSTTHRRRPSSGQRVQPDVQLKRLSVPLEKSPWKAMKLSLSDGSLKLNSVSKQSRPFKEPVVNLRRSPRILDPVNVNVQREKRASFRQNLSEFFVNVTRSFFRIPQQS